MRVLALKSYEVRATHAGFEAMIRCMKAALREVSSNGFKPEDMAKTITVRVPDDLHRMVKERAALEGISMADLVRRELEGTRLTNEQIFIRLRVRPGSKAKTADTVRYIREARGDL